MSQAPPSTAEKLRELKETYFKLFSDHGSDKENTTFPSDEYLLHYKRVNPVQSTSQRGPEEKKNIKDEVGYRRPFDEPSNQVPRLRLRPLLEDLNRKGATEKTNFMLQRMDELAGTRPTKVMDFIKRQYPTSDESSANTFFLLGDVHRCIREYLVSTGWIEKYKDRMSMMGSYDIITSAVSLLEGGAEERIQLTRCLQGYPISDSKTLSAMLSSDPVKFIWVNGFINWSHINNNIIISRIPSSSYYFSKGSEVKSQALTHLFLREFDSSPGCPEHSLHFRPKRMHTKTALASSIRDLFPFLYQKGVIDVKTPRTYEIRCLEDMKHFMKQYRINACISLLRKFASGMDPASKVQLFSEDGSVPLDCMDFAVQRIVEMIRYSQHADLDEWHFSVVSEEDWNVFIYRFYDIVHQDAKFQSNHHNINVPKLTFACENLCTIYDKYFPETKHDGHRNLWIVKPSNGSCGRGVKVFKRLNEIQQYCKPTHCYVIQKYIENPMLIYQTKFDVRQWFLITSVYPLVIWMYNECYLRFCSQPFSLSNVHEAVHLCNNSIQNKYKNGVRNPLLPDENMWPDSTFQTYLSGLESTAVWPAIKNKMQQAIIASCLVSQDKMYHRANSFHLYGADFMITPDYDVWLIEINTHPSMKYSTSVTTRMCKEVLQDTLKVGLDRRTNPQADTGKFVEIYRQQPHMPTVGMPASASGVHAKKLRFLNTINTKDQPTKSFVDTSKTPSKFGKWLSYTSIATYKKHNKINFKYVVLRHTDMPLDPGDSITQRDIGYAGVLDKVNISEKAEEVNEEVSNSSQETGGKEKIKVPTVSSKPPHQITLHRKVIAKLKAKEKMEKENTEVDAENSSNKNTSNAKLQNSNEIKKLITTATINAKQNEVLKPNVEVEAQQSKIVQNEVVEVRSVHEIIRSTPGPSTKEPAPKIQEKLPHPKNNTFVENVKSVSNSENPVTEKKSFNPRKQNNPECVAITEKEKKTNVSEQTTNPKNLVTDKNKSVKRSINKDMIKSVPTEPSPVIKAEDETKPKVIKDTKIFVLEEAIKNRTGLGNSTKASSGVEGTKVSNNNIKRIRSPKINKVKRRLSSAKRNKKPSNSIDKVLLDKSLTDSMNVMRTSKIEKTEDSSERKKLPKQPRAPKGKDTISKSRNIKRKKTETSANKESKANDGPAKQRNKRHSDDEQSRASPPKDSTKKNSHISATKNERKLIGLLKGDKEVDNERKWSKIDTNHNASGDIMLQPTLNQDELIFMMSDSDSSFKTAISLSDDDTTSSAESDTSQERKLLMDENGHENEGESPSASDLLKEKRIRTNPIKRYTKRNKYCE